MPSRSQRFENLADHHQRSAKLSAHFSDDLRDKYGINSLRVRKNDTVKVMRGEFEGVEGKVTSVDAETGRVGVEGVTREKIAGGNVPIKIHASKVMITGLNLDDKWRKNRLEKRG